MSLPKKAAFYAILALIVVAASEMVSSAFLFFAYRDQISSLSGEPLTPSTVLVLRKGLNWLLPGSAPDPAPYRRMTRIPQDFFAEDAEQGYRAKPGRYVFRYARRHDGALEHLDSVVTIKDDGTRFTGNAPPEPARRIHVLGDSFVFGDGVNDEQTFSFLLQAAFPRDAVHLHALSGYSWANALITMDRIKDQIRPGDIVILGYAFYYKERHVAAPGRLRDIKNWMARSFPDTELSPKDKLIRARLDGANHLVLDTIPMHCKFNPDYCTSAEPTPDYTDKVSIELLRAIAARTSGKIYLVHFFGPKNDPVLAKLPGNVELVSATPEDFSYTMRDDIMGFDDHGGPYWHYAIYSRIRQSIAHLRPQD
jgi:hypothetical protein